MLIQFNFVFLKKKMKKILLIFIALPMIGFGQLTYMPDDVFEEYIEDNFPLADNGTYDD